MPLGDGQPLVIAIDYDDTYTRCPGVWDECISIFQDAGHKVICVTCRRRTLENIAFCKIPGLFTYHTELQAKEKFLLERYNLRVDIWIDDQPKYILHNR